MQGFWGELKKPIIALAPMANVSDAAFRQMIAKYGKPDVCFTEFVSTDGLLSTGREKLLVDFWYGEAERPIVAQIFGANPENFYKVAQLVKELKFDGVDINMGCPERSIQKQGSCAALIGNPVLAKEIIAATKEGAGSLPVSVKTRIGLSKITLDEWLPVLLESDLAAITLHLRTRKEMSKVPAHWEVMPQAVSLKNQIAPQTILLGNGDVMTLTEADQKCQETGCDGVMIGRGIFGNPWMFNRQTPIEKIPIAKRLSAMIEHTKLFEQKFTGIKDFDVMKKHYKAYVNNFDGAKELRLKLMEAKTASEVEKMTQEFLIKEKSLA